VIEASLGLTLKMGPNFITLDPSGLAIKGVPFVQINSAGAALSGSPGQAVQLTAPTDATEADNAEPGSVGSTAPSHTSAVVDMSLTTISPATRSAQETEEPGRTAPPPAAAGKTVAPQQEYATFPKNADAVAIAQVLQDAAKSGVPFCEECEKAKQQQQEPTGVAS
jgi:type VI secretion system secreted protein VgrG